MNKKAHWERIYHDRTPSEVSWFQPETTLSLEMIKNAGTPKCAPIIDVGGGASLLVKNLYLSGYRDLTVLDISPRGLVFAQNQMGADSEYIKWIDADITEFDAENRFELWHDRAVFQFLIKKAEREKYVEVLKNTLKPGGTLVLAAFAIGGPVRCSGIDIIQYDAEKLLGELGDSFSLAEESSEMHITPGNREQKFSYFRLDFNP